MHRRQFLQAVLGGMAVLTGAQAATVRQELDRLPDEPMDSIDEDPLSLRWRESVKTRSDLPEDVCESDAAFVESEDLVLVFVGPVGWVQLAASPC